MSLILSLDVTDKEQAKKLIDQTKDFIDCIKVGHVIMPHLDFDYLNNICLNKNIFLDLKFHDIPNTVSKAIIGYSKRIKYLKFVTIHGNSHTEMIKESLLAANNKLKILSVISLTSKDLEKQEFLFQVEKNMELGIKGFITPAPMLKLIREKFGNDVLLVTPGIRNNVNQNDHKQAATSSEAYKNGANYIVVGRPIINSKNPQEEVKQYLKLNT